MAELATVLPQMRYMRYIGLEVLMKTSISKVDRTKLGIKPCCYTPACVSGHHKPGMRGRPERPAPSCDAAQRAYGARVCFAAARAARTHFSSKGADKRADEEMRAYAARDTIEKAYEAGL